MKTPKLLKEAREILSAEKMKRRHRRASLKKILDKLKKRKHKLKERLADEKRPHKKARLEKDLAVIHAQRKKGLKALKDLK